MAMDDSNPSAALPFTVVAERDGGTSCLRLMGEFDLACSEQFHQHLRDLLRSRPEAVIVDLSGLDFIDSSGLRMVVEAESLCRESGLEYGVIAGTGQARRVFDLTGMNEIVPVIDATGNPS
jgi:anti-sigma B factor antagonist